MADSIQIAGRRFRLPGSKFQRTLLGVAFVIGGVFGFLPILGFWMIPLGLLILSVDHSPARRLRRRIEVWWGRRRRRRARKKGGRF